jgi:hypothetical protein
VAHALSTLCRELLTHSQLLIAYTAHTMGANCVAVTEYHISQEESNLHFGVCIGSGGDDQAIALANLSVIIDQVRIVVLC